MKYAIDKQEHLVVINLQEEKLDTRIAPALKGEFVLLSNEGYNNIVLNLKDVRFADSSGLSALLVGNRICEQKDGQLVIFGVQDMVMKVMQISQLNTVLNILPTEQEAMDAIVLGNLELELEDELRLIDKNGQQDGDEEETEEEEEFDDEDDDDWDDDDDEDDLWEDDDEDDEDFDEDDDFDDDEDWEDEDDEDDFED